MLPTYFIEYFQKGYRMIVKCDINGFIIKACEVVERHDGTDCGTKNREYFEVHV